MGQYKDEHMILTCQYAEPLRALRRKILAYIKSSFEDNDLPDFSSYVSPVLHISCQLYSLYLPADGSKEGWETSNNMDDVREKIRADVIYYNAVGEHKISGISVTDERVLKSNTVESKRVLTVDGFGAEDDE